MKLPFISSKEIYERTLDEISTSEIISDQNKKYIESLHESKEKWSLAFRKEEYILGIQTTSRIESLHGIIKKFIRSKCNLNELFIRLLKLSNGRNYIKEFEESIENEITSVLSQNFILSKLKEKYTEFIYNKCLLGYIKAQSYKSTKLKRNCYEVISLDPNNSTKFLVKIEDNYLNCNCWFGKQWGIPCLHMFSTASLAPDKFYDVLPFKSRWLKEEQGIITNDDHLIEFLEENIRKKEGDKGFFLLLEY